MHKYNLLYTIKFIKHVLTPESIYVTPLSETKMFIYINNTGAYLHLTIIYVHHKRLAKLSSRNGTMNFTSLLILTSAFIINLRQTCQNILSVYIMYNELHLYIL